MSDIIGSRRRGPYSRAFKAGIIEQCRQRGAMVGEVAARHGRNLPVRPTLNPTSPL